MKFILLINVKIVGILTFMSRIIITSESYKATKVFIFQHFSFCEQLKFHALTADHEKYFITLGFGLVLN